MKFKILAALNKILYFFSLELSIINKRARAKRKRRKESVNKNIEQKISKSRLKRARRSFDKNIFKQKVKETLPQECWNCGSKENLQIHHIMPISERPDLARDITNLLMLCGKCHCQYHQDCKEK